MYGTANTNISSLALKLIATDTKRASTFTTFNLFINSNRAPLVIQPIPVINVYTGIFFTSQIPDGIFRDLDNDTLTYSVENFDQTNVVPPWMTFIAGNKTLLGMPSSREGSSIYLKFYANDGRNGTAY